MSRTQRRWNIRQAGIALALTTAATAGGLALASPANAAKLGDVNASAVGAPPQEWTAETLFNVTQTVTEGEAWRQCDAAYGEGNTKAIVLTAYDYVEEGDSITYTGHWECHNSPV